MDLDMRDRTIAVTGGGNGIGARVAAELGSLGATVIVVDPGRTVRGEPESPAAAEAVVEAIRAAGGRAELAPISVTDRDGIRALFAEVVARFGALDGVVHAAGTLRMARLPETSEADFTEVIEPHFVGYLNVLSAALPLMLETGYGRVVGFTSGVGLTRTIIDSPAYGCAKRAIASLTWQLGRLLPGGITVNALSPIAATRMVREMLSAGGRNTEGLDLSAMTQVDEVAPAAVYLVSERAAFSTGQVLFSAGSELSLNAPGALIEAVRTSAVTDLGSALDALIPETLLPAQRDQRTAGGYHPRVGDVFHTPAGEPAGGHVLLVADDGEELEKGLAAAGSRVSRADPAMSFDQADADVRGAHDIAGPIDQIVVLGEHTPARGDDPVAFVDAHRDLPAHVLGHASWTRAAARYAADRGRPVAVVLVSRPGGAAAEVSSQLARIVNDTPADGGAIRVFPISWEGGDVATVGALAARLRAPDAADLAGADLVVGAGWLGLRAAPRPMSTLSCGTDGLPDWLDEWFRQALGG